MATRTKRFFSDIAKQKFLDELKTCRDACSRVCAKAPIHCEAYDLAIKLMKDIDAVAEGLTGDGKYFYLKPHSTL